MTTYVHIVDGIVANRALFDGDMPEGWAEDGATWIASEEAQIGWSYDGKEFVEPIVKRAQLSHDELLDNMRAERNRLLRETDWTQLPDSPVDKDEWATYRQALRDLPETVTDAAKVTWPQRPSEKTAKSRSTLSS